MWTLSLRFRRSVKLGKGVRLNVTKRGVGVSFGTRGLRHSIHSTGRRTSTVGIPGSGLYYTKTKTTKGRSRATRASLNTNDVAQNQALVQEYNEHIHLLRNLHQMSDEEINWQEISTLPPPFAAGSIGPNEQQALRAYEQYSPNFIERMITALADKKRQALKRQIVKAKQKDEDEYCEWESLVKLAQQMLAGNKQAYEQVIQEMSIFSDLQKLHFKYAIPNTQMVEAEIQVNLAETIPKETITLTKTGKVSRRAMGKTKYFALAKDYVCSGALWIARNMFAHLPVEHVIVHITEYALNSATGHDEQQVLLAVKFDRPTMKQLNFQKLNPADAMENFTHHMDHLKTKGFRPVTRITENLVK